MGAYFSFILKISTFLFQANEQCPGGSALQDGKCPNFQCINGAASCNNRGQCNNDNTACDCNAGSEGVDCSIILEGKKIVWQDKLCFISLDLSGSKNQN